ncbi:MAG: hypothetical protein ACO21G_01370 [Algoriphagus sp.]
MKKHLLLLLLVASITLSQAQAQDSRPISWKDVAAWKSMPNSGFKLSPDGQWMAYVLTGIETDGDLILQKVADPASKKTFPLGAATFASFEFSDNSQWIAFKEFPKFTEKKANEKSNAKTLKEKLHLIQLASGVKKTFEGTGGFYFTGEAASHLVIALPKEGNGDGKGSDLLIYHLATGKSQNLGNVREHAVNKKGSHLAYTVDAANSQGNGLYLVQLATNSIQVLDSDEAGYQSLNWTEKGDGFAALKFK